MSDLSNRRGAGLDRYDVAELRYAMTKPTQEQLSHIQALLEKKTGWKNVQIQAVHDESIEGGFIVKCGNFEFDWSDSGRAAQLKKALKGELQGEATSPALKSILTKLDQFNLEAENKEVGNVCWVGDGIANVKGISHAFYGEVVEFEDGTKGMVQDIRDDHIGCILFGNDEGIRQSSRVRRTYKPTGIPVGDSFIGRVIDALGNPVDGKGPIVESDYRPVEAPAPGIIDRAPVNEPLETGIVSIDTMFPIGRGQRELIIGDRQTGKTSIAMDTIQNQKGKGVICIYVAIGQKSSTIANLIATLEKTGAMAYSIVLSSTAADPAPLQYLAPYAGTAMAEHFMHQGKDVLIVYDDLSKHAVAYRTISLLLERPPGREAYPGDVFYLHSRLLERSSKLSERLGGGSITALPIIETQAGDVSAYIPTNVISITDGQIFLESDLFFEGMRPAVNVGLSVSRVGSAAQTKAMKKASGPLRIDLAQYREMAVFTQFASDLDDATKKQLNHGAALMELLKQPLGRPFAMCEQVLTMVGANAGKFDDIPVKKIKAFQASMLDYFVHYEQDIIKELEDSRDLTEELKIRIVEVFDQFIPKWKAEEARSESADADEDEE